MSPCPRWNSTESSSGHSKRCIPKYGRTSRSVAGTPSSSAAQSMRSVEFPRKTSLPPGRRRRAASGIQRYGSHQIAAQYSIAAPYSEIAGSKLASGRGASSAFPKMSGNSSPNSAWNRRAFCSCFGELSIPTGRAPRRASHAET